MIRSLSLCTAFAFLILGCKDKPEEIIITSKIGAANLFVNNEEIILDNWQLCDLRYIGDSIYSYDGRIMSSDKKWLLMISFLSYTNSFATPIELNTNPIQDAFHTVIVYQPNYPSNEESITYSSDFNIDGNVSLTKLEQNIGGKFEGNFSLNNISVFSDQSFLLTDTASIAGSFRLEIGKIIQH